MNDANTEYLNKYLERQEIRNNEFSLFLDSVDDELFQITQIVKSIKKKAIDFNGYDFSENIKEVLNDTLLWNTRKVVKWK